MRVTFCGTAAGGSLGPQRSNSGILLETAETGLLLDCGPGTLKNLGVARMAALHAVLFSHLHADHVGDLPYLLGMRSMFAGGGPPDLPVHGPQRTTALVTKVMGMISIMRGVDEASIASPDVTETTPGSQIEVREIRISAETVRHAPDIHALARRFDCGGRSLVYSGDTIPEHETMPSLARNADILVHEGFSQAGLERWTAQLAQGPAERLRALTEATHSRAEEVGKIASAAGVQRLVFTHLMPTEKEEDLQSEAARHFHGEIIAAEDGLGLSL